MIPDIHGHTHSSMMSGKPKAPHTSACAPNILLDPGAGPRLSAQSPLPVRLSCSTRLPCSQSTLQNESYVALDCNYSTNQPECFLTSLQFHYNVLKPPFSTYLKVKMYFNRENSPFLRNTFNPRLGGVWLYPELLNKQSNYFCR